MAAPIFHVKDAYYFEVPKTWHDAGYQSLEEVPKFLTEAHPHATLEEFNHEMSGKILIPQPLGTLKNLYEPASGFCISRFMIIELVIAVLLSAVLIALASHLRRKDRARGRLYNMLEAFVVYIREDVAKPAIGEKDADRFVPFLLTAFFFILACNLLGLVPWLGTITSDLSVTSSLAITTFGIGLISGIQTFGVKGYLGNLAPHMDLPDPLTPLKWLIWVIEAAGLLIKHAVLAIRLFANMVGGHYALAIILSLVIGTLATHGATVWTFTAIFGVVGSALFNLLEVLIALIQAYVFTLLSAIFIGMSIHHH